MLLVGVGIGGAGLTSVLDDASKDDASKVESADIASQEEVPEAPDVLASVDQKATTPEEPLGPLSTTNSGNEETYPENLNTEITDIKTEKSGAEHNGHTTEEGVSSQKDDSAMTINEITETQQTKEGLYNGEKGTDKTLEVDTKESGGYVEATVEGEPQNAEGPVSPPNVHREKTQETGDMETHDKLENPLRIKDDTDKPDTDQEKDTVDTDQDKHDGASQPGQTKTDMDISKESETKGREDIRVGGSTTETEKEGDEGFQNAQGSPKENDDGSVNGSLESKTTEDLAEVHVSDDGRPTLTTDDIPRSSLPKETPRTGHQDHGNNRQISDEMETVVGEMAGHIETTDMDTSHPEQQGEPGEEYDKDTPSAPNHEAEDVKESTQSGTVSDADRPPSSKTNAEQPNGNMDKDKPTSDVPGKTAINDLGDVGKKNTFVIEDEDRKSSEEDTLDPLQMTQHDEPERSASENITSPKHCDETSTEGNTNSPKPEEHNGQHTQSSTDLTPPTEPNNAAKSARGPSSGTSPHEVPQSNSPKPENHNDQLISTGNVSPKAEEEVQKRGSYTVKSTGTNTDSSGVAESKTTILTGPAKKKSKSSLNQPDQTTVPENESRNRDNRKGMNENGSMDESNTERDPTSGERQDNVDTAPRVSRNEADGTRQTPDGTGKEVQAETVQSDFPVDFIVGEIMRDGAYTGQPPVGYPLSPRRTPEGNDANSSQEETAKGISDEAQIAEQVSQKEVLAKAEECATGDTSAERRKDPDQRYSPGNTGRKDGTVPLSTVSPPGSERPHTQGDSSRPNITDMPIKTDPDPSPREPDLAEKKDTPTDLGDIDDVYGYDEWDDETIDPGSDDGSIAEDASIRYEPVPRSVGDDFVPDSRATVVLGEPGITEGAAADTNLVKDKILGLNALKVEGTSQGGDSGIGGSASDMHTLTKPHQVSGKTSTINEPQNVVDQSLIRTMVSSIIDKSTSELQEEYAALNI